MADVSERLEGKKFFAGHVTLTSVALPKGPRAAIGDDEVEDGAGIDASKLRRRMALRASQGNVAAVAETRIIHTGYGVNSCSGVAGYSGDVTNTNSLDFTIDSITSMDDPGLSYCCDVSL